MQPGPARLDLLLPDESATERLGTLLASILSPGDVVALIGDLGAGKTRLVQAIAAGLGTPPEAVNSPTFTLIQEYTGDVTLRHCDAYRLRRPEEFPDLGLDELFAEDGVALIEWADRVLTYLPRDRLEIRLTAVGPTSRRAEICGRERRGEALVRALQSAVGSEFEA
ncbi:MAG: tRNA (adenosine(37)-N6)-threonylcarbamoyltransferase complex ATPase subunit type 1 TsaE [Planctomycetaceae bacterium]|nr:tRNA (adenosine(37)-N6)-threonylcarbamoyltransferase complex ATPase subunit type 1 TsaE [Planctomycetaceae bacterium]